MSSSTAPSRSPNRRRLRDARPDTAGDGPLLVPYEALSQRVDALLASLRTSPRLRSAFAADPRRLVSERILGEPALATIELSRANRITNALLDNPRLHAWARAYESVTWRRAMASRPRDGMEARRRALSLMTDTGALRHLAHGLTEYGDAALLRALTTEPAVASDVSHAHALGVFRALAARVDAALATVDASRVPRMRTWLERVERFARLLDAEADGCRDAHRSSATSAAPPPSAQGGRGA